MKAYEALFLVDSGLAASNWDGVNDAIKKVLDRANAEVVSIRKWDERRLAYPVKGKKRGTYLIAYFKCDPLKILGIERDVNLSEEIIRAMILKGDHLTDENMQKDTPWMMIEKDPELAAARRKAEMEAEARERQSSYEEEEVVEQESDEQEQSQDDQELQETQQD
jgi:small subunit ribosomal protein S6